MKRLSQVPRHPEYAVYVDGHCQLVTGSAHNAIQTVRRMSPSGHRIEISRTYYTLPTANRPHHSYRWILTRGYKQTEQFIYRNR